LEPAPLPSDELPPTEAELPPIEAEFPPVALEFAPLVFAPPALHAPEPRPPSRAAATTPATPSFEFRMSAQFSTRLR